MPQIQPGDGRSSKTLGSGMSYVLARNIRALDERRRLEERHANLSACIAEAVTRFAGSMRSVYLHFAVFGIWVIVNLGWIPGLEPWDPSFVVLAMIASVEAIFLTSFILISQNRMAVAESKRAELDLQISLLAEDEITELAKLTVAIAQHLGVPTQHDAVGEMTKPIAPETVLDALEEDQPPSPPK
jgi:uncharacterized membrane protein